MAVLGQIPSKTLGVLPVHIKFDVLSVIDSNKSAGETATLFNFQLRMGQSHSGGSGAEPLRLNKRLVTQKREERRNETDI